jgi:hypothetical protein
VWRSGRKGVGAAAAAAALALLAGGVARADPPVLYVTWHADRSLSAMLADGTAVGSTTGAGAAIPAGTYKVQIDNSANVDVAFDLAGPGVKLVDSLSNGEELAAAYTETFQPGSTYTFRDDNHPSAVWTFQTSAATVGISTGQTTATTAPTGSQSSSDVAGSAIPPLRGALRAVVGARGAVRLTFLERPLPRLRAGRYRVTVTDDSPRRGLELQRLHLRPQRLTGAAFVGTRTLILELGPGRWFYFATPARRRPSFVVS